ncbi:hypothetical protein [Desulfogranum mediterraneum]|uniref:hypothetical protein n=1 Tax=Desulfogranum mediterraneum TaxID=160661 RepID=UPI00040A924E|nr:hypothetical protein [Desulfogranum mediterraneum]
MARNPIPLLGGKSVHCINEQQMAEAWRLAEEDPNSSPKIQASLKELEAGLSRNELAALAFVLIQRLKSSSPFRAAARQARPPHPAGSKAQ